VTALEVLALALWTPVGVFGLWLVVTGRRLIGFPKWLKEGWQLRVLGLMYVVLGGYFAYRALRDGSFAPDGVFGAYLALILAGLFALYRRQKTRRTETVGPRP
jgi:hypothetical protein